MCLLACLPSVQQGSDQTRPDPHLQLVQRDACGRMLVCNHAGSCWWRSLPCLLSIQNRLHVLAACAGGLAYHATTPCVRSTVEHPGAIKCHDEGKRQEHANKHANSETAANEQRSTCRRERGERKERETSCLCSAAMTNTGRCSQCRLPPRPDGRHHCCRSPQPPQTHSNKTVQVGPIPNPCHQAGQQLECLEQKLVGLLGHCNNTCKSP